jgi:small multidrug resistance pump
MYKNILQLAGVYNVIWGGFVILFPHLMFDWAGMERPNYLELWQCVGMIVGVYGVGYWIAATDPIKHFPIVLVGFLGKVFGPIGFAQALWSQKFSLGFGINILFNDVIWWIPFFLILREKWRRDGSFLH